jgi:hypothetical protein
MTVGDLERVVGASTQSRRMLGVWVPSLERSEVAIEVFRDADYAVPSKRGLRKVRGFRHVRKDL